MRGAVYEGLTVSPEGGKPTLPWLARTWTWSNGNKTLTLNLAKGVKWSDGKPLTSVDVVYSLTAGKQNKVMDLDRPDAAGHQHRVREGARRVPGAHQPEDARLAVHRGDAQRAST